MADVPTANYGWVKPDPGASDNTWGTKINTDLDGIDGVVKGIDTSKLPLAGGTLTGGLSFGDVMAANPQDLTKHVALWSPTYGFCITPGQLNYNAGQHVFWAGPSLVATLAANVLQLGSGVSIATNGVGGVTNHVEISAETGYASFYSTKYSSDQNANWLSLQKARGTTAAPTVVANGDTLGSMYFAGWDGGNWINAVSMRGVVYETAPAAGRLGAQWQLGATPPGTEAPTTGLTFDFTNGLVCSASTVRIQPNPGLGGSSAWLTLAKTASGQGNVINGYTGAVTNANARWSMLLGDATAEAGGNAGSNFSLSSFSDAGAFLQTPLAISRATGLATLAGDPVANLGAATKQYVDAGAGSFINKLRNGTFDVWQRGGGGIAAPASLWTYTADGWQVSASGAGVTVEQTTGAVGQGLGTLSALGISCGAGTTYVFVRQCIESAVAAPLVGKRVTFQALLFNGTGNPSFTPQIVVMTPNSQDAFNGPLTTVLAQVNMQPVTVTGTFVPVAYSFDVPTTAINGLAITYLWPTTPSGFYATTACDCRATPGRPVGLCANPPPPELRPIHEELAFCQRYYHAGPLMTWQGQTTSGALYTSMVQLSPVMRAVPTITLTYNSGGGFPSTNPAAGWITTGGFSASSTANTTAGSSWFAYGWTASAEL